MSRNPDNPLPSNNFFPDLKMGARRIGPRRTLNEMSPEDALRQIGPPPGGYQHEKRQAQADEIIPDLDEILPLGSFPGVTPADGLIDLGPVDIDDDTPDDPGRPSSADGKIEFTVR